MDATGGFRRLGIMDHLVPDFQASFYDEWHFSPVVFHEHTAFLSGVTAMREDGTYAPDPKTHFRDLFTNLGRVLEYAGLGFEDAIEMTSYHCDMTTLDRFRQVRDEYVVEPWPAWTAVGVTELATPGAQAEIRLICRAPGRG